MNPRAVSHSSAEDQWQGRLSVRIDSTPVQSLSSAFELRGDLTNGELVLTSPLGTVLAQARWDARGVQWQAGSETAVFANLDELAWRLTGTALPFAALWDWLRGMPTQAGGWQVNLQDYAQGRISAQREQPLPTATLRIVLER
ncbi:lipoprotein insertase outer membrane protein LolB [Curvibacter sp. APW13]|uniref:lipoprotein insertase outer membrane protein LolB n=1 Tax=Curvibacter sp. APW13 TaxID=3077236 RepID=UPI0028DF96C7|nr:lipoprotein insertase outer membrane protein LolB [Curvibacter sp. APW13]MDT8992463.1 lipoprotein insertase outer membrane protein LolB [Curvibacter sp. APW13]